MTITTINPSEDTKVSEFRAAFRKASKAGAVTDSLLQAGVVLFGDPKAETDAVVKAEALVAQGRELLAAHESNAKAWLVLASQARDGGVSARQWAEAMGGNPNTLGRLARAHDVYEAAKANKSPMTVGQAITLGNQRNASEITSLVVAYGEAEEGHDPVSGTTSIKAAGPSVPTVESFVKAAERLAGTLSTLLAEDFPTPKADTLEQVKALHATFERMAKQSDRLATRVAKAGRSVSKADRVAKSA